VFKPGCLSKILGVTFIALGLMIVGAFFFPVPRPHVHLPAQAIFHLGPFPITNTLLASWFTILVLLLIFYLGTRRMKLVPSGWQNLVEWVYESLYNFVEGAAGEKNARRFFPVVATIFLYVFVAALLSLLPGFDTIGFGHYPKEPLPGAFLGSYQGWVVEVPLLRKANTDINFPLALALISFVCVEYWGITSVGLRRYLGKFIRLGELLRALGGLLRGKFRPMELLTGAVALFVGALEAVSEFVRIISFTFRLFGNMNAGMILLLLILFLFPWVVGVPFYGLEAFFGFVQALIFGGLTLVFGVIAVTPPEHE